jgi:O-antigen/teichoic acid export membrane protein
MTVFGAVTNARHGFVLNNSIALAMVVVNAVVTYLVLESGGGLVMLVTATTAASMLGYVAYGWSARHTFPGLSLRIGHFRKALWRDVTTFSIYLFVVDMASQLTFNLDNIVVGAVLGTSAVAVYAVAIRLSEYQRRVCDQFSGMLYTVAVGIGAGGRSEQLRKVLIEGTRLAVVLVVGVTICLVGFSGPLITRWMGAGFNGSVLPFVVLAAAGIVIVGHATQQSILLATGHHRTVAAVWIVEAVANLALSITLVRWLGPVGVAIGTAIPITVGHLAVMSPAAARAVGLSLRLYARAAVLPAVIGAIPAAAACILIRLMFVAPSLHTVAVAAMLVGGIYAAVVFACGLDRDTRRLYLVQLRGVIPVSYAPIARIARTRQADE